MVDVLKHQASDMVVYLQQSSMYKCSKTMSKFCMAYKQRWQIAEMDFKGGTHSYATPMSQSLRTPGGIQSTIDPESYEMATTTATGWPSLSLSLRPNSTHSDEIKVRLWSFTAIKTKQSIHRVVRNDKNNYSNKKCLHWLRRVQWTLGS